MNLFEKMNPLTNKVGITIPSTVDVTQEIDNRPFVERTIITLSTLFGGATAVEQSGGWMSDTEGLVIEKSTLVYSYASELNTDILNEVYRLAEQLAEELNQEAVAVEINGSMYFVEQAEEKDIVKAG